MSTFVERRIELGYPVDEKTIKNSKYIQIPHENLKGIYLKKPYSGSIKLQLSGGQIIKTVYDSSNNVCPHNLLETFNNLLLAGLTYYQRFVLYDSEQILISSDFVFQHTDEKYDNKITNVQMFRGTDGKMNRIIYANKMTSIV